MPHIHRIPRPGTAPIATVTLTRPSPVSPHPLAKPASPQWRRRGALPLSGRTHLDLALPQAFSTPLERCTTHLHCSHLQPFPTHRRGPFSTHLHREVVFSDVDGTLVHYPDLMNRLGSIQESAESATGLVFINKVRHLPYPPGGLT